MNDPRPEYTVVRVCFNCTFFTRARRKGLCTLPQVMDPSAAPLKTHGQCSCDAHIWKAKSTAVQKIALEYGAQMPKDVI